MSISYLYLPTCTIPDYESETELVRYLVQVNDGTDRRFSVESMADGLGYVKAFVGRGIMCRVIVEKAYWTKQARALRLSDLQPVYAYFLNWKQVN